MKRAIFTVSMIFLLSFGSLAYADSLAQITNLEGNRGFPTELVTVEYVRHCTQEFSQAWMKQSFHNQVGIAITLKQVSKPCSMHETSWVTESVTLPIPADVPTTYYSLRNLDGVGSFSGVSIDNFN